MSGGGRTIGKQMMENGRMDGLRTAGQMPGRSDVKQWRAILGPLVGYVALSVALTWPLITQFVTHVPGDGIDDPALAWNLWWVKHALVDQLQNPFWVDWQFWPVGVNLAFYTLTVLNGMLSIPLQVVFGVIPAYNLLLLSAFVLGGFGAYLLCRDFLHRNTSAASHRSAILAAFLGGVFYAFASAKLFYAALGQGNIASSQWLPFAALYLIRAARPQGRFRDAALAALFFVFQAYAELTFASFLLIFVGFVAVWGAVRLWVNRSRAAADPQRPAPLVGLAQRGVLLALLVALGIAPILAAMLPDLQAEGDFFTSGGGFADLFSADLAGYALPTQLHPVFGDVIRRVANDSAPRADGSQFPVNKGQQIYLGYTALALSAVGLWQGRRRPELRFWAAASLLFFLLTLGPSLRVTGHDWRIPLPFSGIAQLPFFKGNRYPSRYSVMLLLSLAPLLALGARWLLDGRHRTRRYALMILLFTLLVFEHLSVPLPLSDLRVPALYAQVAVEPGDFALLELPLGWRNGARVAGKQDIVIMQELWSQTLHGKRVLGGNTSRNPEFKFQFFSEDPTLARWIALTNAADVPQHTALRAALAADPPTPEAAIRARDWAATWNVRYVMMHRAKLPPAAEATLQQLLPVTLVGEGDDLALYRIEADLTPPQRFVVGTDAGRMILAEGWSPAGLAEFVYAQRREARLLLPLGNTARQLRLEMWALAPDQAVTLSVDGRAVAMQPLSPQRGWLTFELPTDPTRPHLSDVRLRFATLADIAEGSSQPVGRTGAFSPIAILARSAGQETGDFGHIYLGGVEVSLNRRGYNLAALDPTAGRLLDVAAFDTHADPAASGQLAAWVRSLPAGTIVVGAARDEAAMNLSVDAVTALQSLGSAVDLRDHFRWGHAFVGAVGANPGSALEQMTGERVAQVRVGMANSAPQVAAALAEVAIVK